MLVPSKTTLPYIPLQLSSVVKPPHCCWDAVIAVRRRVRTARDTTTWPRCSRFEHSPSFNRNPQKRWGGVVAHFQTGPPLYARLPVKLSTSFAQTLRGSVQGSWMQLRSERPVFSWSASSIPGLLLPIWGMGPPCAHKNGRAAPPEPSITQHWILQSFYLPWKHFNLQHLRYPLHSAPALVHSFILSIIRSSTSPHHSFVSTMTGYNQLPALRSQMEPGAIW